MNQLKKVIVIGAGASGIAAATRLYERGIRNILVLEAENRIGGRVHTVDLPNNDGVVEFGAQWVHGEKDNVVYEMGAAQNLLHHVDSAFKSKLAMIRSSGEIVDEDVAAKMLELFEHVKENLDLSEVKIGDSTADYFIPKLEEAFHVLNSGMISADMKKEFIEFCHNMMNGMDGSDSWYDSSISTLDEYIDCDGDLLTSWNEDGYKSIFSLLMEKCQKISDDKFINETIVTNKLVNKICFDDDIVHVKCSDGTTYSADHVIVTVSLGVLKEKHDDMFEGITLPESKILAIDNIGIGTVNKAFVKFSGPCFPEHIQNLGFMWNDEHKKEYSERGLGWVTDIFAIVRCKHAPNVLCAWIVGSSSREMETLNEAEILSQITSLLRKLFAEKFDIPDAVYCLRSSWSSNKHFSGSYSFRTPASEKLGITSTCLSSPLLNKNDIPVILFAGEATHPHYYSTVHGAIESGWREADRIISLS